MLKLSCGNCGKDKFNMYKNNETKDIVCECDNCNSTTIITVQPQVIKLDWGENSQGILCTL